MLKKIYIVIAACLYVQFAYAQADTLPEPDRMAEDFVEVSLLVAGPGKVLYSVVGHAALRLQCPYYGLDYVFSYESEGVGGKVGRFLIGDLKMGMMAITPDEYLSIYEEEGRSVTEYVLWLPAEAKTELWRLLDEKLLEGMNLPYNYIERGCARSCRESIEQVAQIEYDNKTWNDYRTLREHFYDNSPNGWPLFWAMSLVGGDVDKKITDAREGLIIPRELIAAWKKAEVDGRPLIVEEKDILPAINDYQGDKFTPMMVAVILLIISVFNIFCKYPYLDWIFLCIYTLFGLLMCWMLVAPLAGNGWRWLIIPFNPLPAICWRWRRYWAVPWAVIVILWCVGVSLAPHRLVDLAHIVLALSFLLVVCKTRIQDFLGLSHNTKNKSKIC